MNFGLDLHDHDLHILQSILIFMKAIVFESVFIKYINWLFTVNYFLTVIFSFFFFSYACYDQ